MHTLKVLCTGIGILALGNLLGRKANGSRGGVLAAQLFVPVWAVGTGLNLYNGTRHGYTVREELPIAVLVFLVPAGLAVASIRHARR